MPVPITGTRLTDVRTEIGGIGAYSLQDAFNDAFSSGFDNTYAVVGNTLKDFRNYSHTLISTSLAYNASSSSTACAAFPSTYYTDTGSLSSATYLSANSNGSPAAPSGYYSDQTQWRFWNNTTETFTSSGSC